MSKISIYPNPSLGQFSIKMESGQEDKLKITVVDMLGIVVKEELSIPLKTGLNYLSLNLQDLPPGFLTGKSVE